MSDADRVSLVMIMTNQSFCEMVQHEYALNNAPDSKAVRVEYIMAKLQWETDVKYAYKSLVE